MSEFPDRESVGYVPRSVAFVKHFYQAYDYLGQCVWNAKLDGAKLPYPFRKKLNNDLTSLTKGTERRKLKTKCESVLKFDKEEFSKAVFSFRGTSKASVCEYVEKKFCLYPFVKMGSGGTFPCGRLATQVLRTCRAFAACTPGPQANKAFGETLFRLLETEVLRSRYDLWNVDQDNKRGAEEKKERNEAKKANERKRKQRVDREEKKLKATKKRKMEVASAMKKKIQDLKNSLTRCSRLAHGMNFEPPNLEVLVRRLEKLKKKLTGPLRVKSLADAVTLKANLDSEVIEAEAAVKEKVKKIKEVDSTFDYDMQLKLWDRANNTKASRSQVWTAVRGQTVQRAQAGESPFNDLMKGKIDTSVFPELKPASPLAGASE